YEHLRVPPPPPAATTPISGRDVRANRGVRAERRDRLRLLLVQTVADIGGGKGTLLAAILRALSICTASCSTVQRWEPMPPTCFGQLASPIAARSCRETSSGASRSVPTATFWRTCCTTGMTQIRCEYWRNRRRAMAKDGRVLIVERLIPDDPAGCRAG